MKSAEDKKNIVYNNLNKDCKKETTKDCYNNKSGDCCYQKNNGDGYAYSVANSGGNLDSENLQIENSDDCGGGCCGIESNNKGSNRAKVVLLISLLSLIISFINPFSNFPPYVRLFDFAWIAIILCGYPIYKGAIKNVIKNKKVTSSLLISLAMTASIVMGILDIFEVTGLEAHSEHYLFAAGEIAFLMAIGEFVEDWTVGKSKAAVSELIAMKPSTANLKTDNGYTVVNLSDIQVGDIVLIRPNEIIGIDGEVVKGEGTIDTSSITGESLPLDVRQGDKVFAGSTNLAYALEVKATKLSEDSTISKMIDYVKNAEKNKAPINRLADKWASYLVPIAVALSILVFLTAYFLMSVDFLASIKRGITILVVVCPCALALATPIAIAAGIGNASRKGILIKSGASLELLAKIKGVAFDKTGTLTEGKLEVKDVVSWGMDKGELMRYAAAAEMQSEHPIAKAIVNYVGDKTLLPEWTKSYTGVGVTALVKGKVISVVKYSEVQKELKETGIELDNNTGATVVAVLVDDIPKGVIYLWDTIREGAKNVVSNLHNEGYQTAILTGDNSASGDYVGEKLGIDRVFSGLLPHDKVDVIKKLKEKGGIVMVGDGINDAPALATSDVSVAMGAVGNSIAIETADISLMNSDLNNLPYLLALSKRTLFTIKANITLSLLISLMAVILSLTGNLSVVGGAFVHNAGSVLVCLNAAFLLLFKGKKRKHRIKK